MYARNEIRLTNLLGLDYRHQLLKTSFLILFGVVALSCASQLSIPYLPVPLTFQSATVVLIGLLYGARYSSYVILLYLMAGIMGAPVFADFSAGFDKILGPTGGYLISFLPAAWLSGFLAEKGFGNHWGLAFIAALIGTMVIFFSGWLMLSTFVGFKAAFHLGVLPFVIPELIKLGVVCFIVPKCWKHSSNVNL